MSLRGPSACAAMPDAAGEGAHEPRGHTLRPVAELSTRGACALATWLLLLAACRPGPVARPYPPPTPDELLRVLETRRQAVHSANLRVRATSFLGGERIRATVETLLERDGHLRFEAEVSLQGTVAILTVDGPNFALLDLRKSELLRGPACPENVASMIRIPLEAADVAALLLGDVPSIPQADTKTAVVAWDDGRGEDVLTAGPLRVTFMRAAGGYRITGATALRTTAPAGATAWRVRFEDFEAARGVTLPRVIRFAEGNGSFDDGVDITIKDREINPTIPEDRFRLTAPEGTKTIDIGCGAL